MATTLNFTSGTIIPTGSTYEIPRIGSPYFDFNPLFFPQDYGGVDSSMQIKDESHEKLQSVISYFYKR